MIRRLLPAVAIAVGLGWDRDVAASMISFAPASAVEGDDHAQHCRCRHCNGQRCCCGPRRAKPHAPQAAAPAMPARAVDGPGLSTGPCDEAGLPDTPAPVPSGKVASLATVPHRFPPAACRHPFDGEPCIFPSRRAARLDEPPEGPDLA